MHIQYAFTSFVRKSEIHFPYYMYISISPENLGSQEWDPAQRLRCGENSERDNSKTQLVISTTRKRVTRVQRMLCTGTQNNLWLLLMRCGRKQPFVRQKFQILSITSPFSCGNINFHPLDTSILYIYLKTMIYSVYTQSSQVYWNTTHTTSKTIMHITFVQFKLKRIHFNSYE